MTDLYEQVAGTVRAFLAKGKAVSTEIVTTYLCDAIQLPVAEAEVEKCILALVARELREKESEHPALPHTLPYEQAWMFGYSVFARVDDDYGFMVVKAPCGDRFCYITYSVCRSDKTEPKPVFLSLDENTIPHYLSEMGFYPKWMPLALDCALKRLHTTEKFMQDLIAYFYPQLIGESANGQLRLQ